MRIRPVVKTSILLVAKIFLITIIVAWAANSAIQPVNYTGETGGLDNTSNQLLTTAKGFSKTSAASAVGASGCLSAVTFGSGTVANNALTGGDIIFDAQVNTTATTPSSTCFTVTFYLSTSIGSQTTFGPVYLSTGASVTPGQAIDCKFDLGSSSLPTPPFSYKLAVQ
jgi:hypothetical protein